RAVRPHLRAAACPLPPGRPVSAEGHAADGAGPRPGTRPPGCDFAGDGSHVRAGSTLTQEPSAGARAGVGGSGAAVEQCRRAVPPEGSVAQAWLIPGPPGSGRSTAARAFAGTLQCEGGTGCGTSRACRTTAAGTHPDVTVVATDTLSS